MTSTIWFRFGEYLPFRAVLARLGIDKIVQGSPVDFSPGDGARTVLSRRRAEL